MKKSLWIIIGVVFFYSCGGGNPGDNLSEMSFEVDSTLLAKKVVLTDPSISYHTPVNWKMTGSSLPDSLQDYIRIPDSAFTYSLSPVEIYEAQPAESVMVVSRINDLSGNQLKSLTQAYRRIFNYDLKWERVRHEAFRYNGFVVHQFLLQNRHRINFRLIYTTNRQEQFQVDYIIPAAVYPDYVRAIESSIGSFNQI